MSERRRYFRIDDYIQLSYLPVDRQQVNNVAPESFFPDAGLITLQAELKKIDSETSQLLFQIRDQNRHLGEYLQLVNRKIDLLGQQLMASQHLTDQPGPSREVNLSEEGIAFTNADALEIKQYIALHLVFLPSYAGVVLFAQVTRCEPHRNGQFLIAAQFQQPSGTQLQLLSQQIMHAQLADKRRRLQQSNSGA